MSIKTLIGILLFAIFFSSQLALSEVEVKGVATYTYEKKTLRKKRPTPKDYTAAQTKAVEAAWMQYTSGFNPAKMKNYMRWEDEIRKDISRYVISSIVVENQVDTSSLTITCVVKVKINDVALEAKLSALSASGNLSTGEGSLIVFVFTTRQIQSAKSFENKTTTVEGARTSSHSTESSSGDTVSREESSDVEESSGGTVERRSEALKYKLANDSISFEDIDSTMNAVLSPNGFEVSSYDDVVSICGGVERTVIESEFIFTNSMSRASRRSAINASRECDIGLFAVGTLDIGAPSIDSVTGNVVVTVSVRAGVSDITNRLPKRVASIGPIQASGWGTDEQSAGREALKAAATEAAKVIVDQLNAKGIN